MAKDAYYFSHDSNAKDDPKCVLLIEQLGMEGYGIFWVLIETLRDQPGYKYPIALIPAMARRYCTTAEKMKAVIMSYGLFEIENDEFFYSDSLNRRMEHLEHRREIASRAGKESAKKRLLLDNGSTNVQPTFNECSTSKVKESKVNKSKVKDIKESTSVPPTTERINYDEYLTAFILSCPSLPAPNDSAKWNAARKKAIREKHMTVEQMEPIFKRIEKSDFLTGKVKDFRCSIDWILKPSNWQKINEGNYDNRNTQPQQKKDKGTYDLDEYDRMTEVPPV